jgi:hypothetical protein
MLVTLWSIGPPTIARLAQARLLELAEGDLFLDRWVAALVVLGDRRTTGRSAGCGPLHWSIIVTAAAVVVLPLVLLMVTVMLLAVASLVIPARRQRYLLAVLDRLVKITTALRGSSK